MNGLPISYYNLRRAFFFFKILFVLSFFVVAGGNIYNAVFKKTIEVSESGHILKDGFVLFTDRTEYINILKNYKYDAGTKIKFHIMAKGESYWDVAVRNGITVETLIAANPFITSLLAEENIEIAIPEKNGVLLPCDDFLDAYRMKKLLSVRPKGNFKHSIFELFALDDIRFAFYEGVRPIIVNNYIEGLYGIKQSFNKPVDKGNFGSMFGMRSDPFTGMMAFHQGLDITGSIGMEIHPINEGIVSFAGWRDGLGLAVIVMHKEGYISTYAHCSQLISKPGDHVTKKDVIALLGNTGRSTGPHVHVEIERHGKLYNPLYFIW